MDPDNKVSKYAPKAWKSSHEYVSPMHICNEVLSQDSILFMIGVTTRGCVVIVIKYCSRVALRPQAAVEGINVPLK